MRLWEQYENPNWLARAARQQGLSGQTAGVFRDLSQSVHEFGRAQFASSYARGGFAATAFAPTTKDALLNPFKRTRSYGSKGHIKNLQKLAQLNPGDKGIQKALKSAEGSKGVFKGMAGRVAGFGLGAAFTVAPLFTTPGGLDEKLRATAASGASAVGWAAGAKVGTSIGAGVGSAILPGVGTAVGAVGGFVVGGLVGATGADQLVTAGFRFADHLVESERAKRNLNWINDSSAFQTRKAATMRQQSLQAMNRGMMSSRSVLGREAAFMHM